MPQPYQPLCSRTGEATKITFKYPQGPVPSLKLIPVAGLRGEGLICHVI
jgi:hypothetical protein